MYDYQAGFGYSTTMKINFCNLGIKGRAPVSLVLLNLNGLDQEASDSHKDTVENEPLPPSAE